MTKGTDGRVSVEFLRECFEYREGDLYWKARPESHFQKPADCAAFNTKTAGKKAGKLSAEGYITIGLRVNCRAISMAAHRVVWALHHGRWPEQHLDHIDRVRSHNRIENLREVTPAENNQNSARKRVHPYVAEHKWGGYSAQVRIGDTNIHLGVFDTEEDARAHREMVCGELEKLARSLAKKSKTGRKRRAHQTVSPSTTDGAPK